MTFVSYAQNFEDVLLWRALGHIRSGSYIDVGAAHPDIDSVTRAFYERGWRGINIEPVVADFHRLQASRPRDLTLGVALGARAGAAKLFNVAGTGLSTLQPQAADDVYRQGFEIHQSDVVVETLASICETHVSGTIHFLKIDVEGAEHDVLLGADFGRFRPWIVLLEATAPMSTVTTHAAWEPILTNAGYRFVWFDGLNRFYVAEEHWDALSPHFQAPPNVFDDFIRAADTELARRIAQAETAGAKETARADAAETRERGLQAQLDVVVQTFTKEQIAHLRTQFAKGLHSLETGRHITHLEATSAAAEQRARLAESWLGAVYASTSWRLTGPLRGAVRLAAKLRGERREEHAPPVDLPIEPAPRAPGLVTAPLEQRSIRSVHQFHSGSAVGDAITNAMLLTRRMLRDFGYVSEIFVEHLDPALAADLRPMNELPRDGNYVLIMRHSMGYDAFDHIAALPVPKVLIYHNITPAEFLVGVPFLQRYAEIGRNQLSRLPGIVAAALADSDYNAIELARLGFEAPAACTLLFDVATLRAHAGVRRQTGIFTVMFVGRLSPAKAQLDLVIAFAAFRVLFREPCRLLLVGRHGDEADTYRRTVERHIRSHGLGKAVTLTGLVSDDELHAIYDEADLYVSLSHHEGFGVPLVEAMAHGVPVLAWPSGAVPYTLGGGGVILSDRAPDAVAQQIASLARNPERRAAVVKQQHRLLERFDLARQGKVLAGALMRAGAAPPRDAELHRALATNLRFAITGHFSGSYSLAAVNRTLALQLEAERPGSVRVLPVEGQPTDDVSGVSDDMGKSLRELTARPAPPTGPEVVISQHYPVYAPAIRGDILLALFFWEESLVPHEIVKTLNGSFDGVVAPSHFTAKALRDSGVQLPIAVIGHAPDLTPYVGLAKTLGAAATSFTFLHISSAFPRKGIDLLLTAYVRTFRSIDQVRLIIKTFPNPHNTVEEQVAALQASDPQAPMITVLNRDFCERELLELYATADVVVLPTRGEGFNLPAAEAMAAGIPLIVTGFGGHMDFCSEETVRLLNYRFAASRSHFTSAGSVWVEPDIDDLAAALQDAVSRPDLGRLRAQRAAAVVRERLAPVKVVRRLADAAVDALLRSPTPETRIAWISSWGVRCGIAEYSRFLLGAVLADASINSVTILADERPRIDGQGSYLVESAWRLVDQSSVTSLAAAVSKLDANVVVIQHQPALFSWSTLAGLLEMPTLTNLVVTVTLHNTRDLLQRDPAERSWAIEALRRVSRVIVHTIADVDLLDDFGLSENVVLFPQGVPTFRAAAPIRSLPRTGKPIVGCFGFFLPEKGIRQLIEALPLLRRQWPSVRLRLINARYDTEESAAEIEACREAAARAGVSDAIEWLTDFLPIERSVELLGQCDLVVLPYQASSEASSAALRTALSAGACVAVTPLPLFDEAADAVVKLDGMDPETLADGIAGLLRDPQRRADSQRNASIWAQQREWGALATRLVSMLKGLQLDVGHQLLD